MTEILLLAAVIVIACVLCNKISGKLGVPMLLAFILLGMLFGSDGLFKIPFDNYGFADNICSVALIYIMFYGGFGTKWSAARPVATRAVLLSSFGTILTAGFVGLFCAFVLKLPLLESFLLGAVMSSTDAASVFSILRSKKLALRFGTDSLLELESGSNDPFSYMLTVLILSLMKGEATTGNITLLLVSQLFFGVLIGVAVAGLTLLVLKYLRLPANGFDAIFIFGVALLSFAISAALGGNGYLSVYITGILLGNNSFGNKRSLVHFFDGLTGLMQMLIFFLLGLLSFPSKLLGVAGIGLAIALFLTFVARPLAVHLLMLPFKSPLRQTALVSFCGMRGAASIVFAIVAVNQHAKLDNDIYHVVFFVVLFSILIQGTLLPFVSKILNMTDAEADVLKTFTDYSDRVPVQFIRFSITPSHDWIGKKLSEIVLPPESLLVLLLRDGKKTVPKGNTVLKEGDTLILSGKASGHIDGISLYEHTVTADDEMCHKKLSEIQKKDGLIIMIQRGKSVVIPRGNTILKENDVLVINDTDFEE